MRQHGWRTPNEMAGKLTRGRFWNPECIELRSSDMLIESNRSSRPFRALIYFLPNPRPVRPGLIPYRPLGLARIATIGACNPARPV
jgi:hypothetical protein